MIITAKFYLFTLIGIVLMLLGIWVDSQGFAKKINAKIVKVLRKILALALVVIILYLCWLNFPATLTLVVAVLGVILVVDKLFFYRQRTADQHSPPFVVENAYSLFWVLLLVWVIRSFIIQPYRVPTGSLQPTVKPGDLLLVNQFAYGLRFPVINTQLVPVGTPQRGDIVLFYSPKDPTRLLVKRVIGLPGDHVAYKDKVLSINGQTMVQTHLGETVDDEPLTAYNPEEHIPVLHKRENLMGVAHEIFMTPDPGGPYSNFSITVPPGEYFMMGDNRDNSDDSRSWGFVPEHNLVGKAFVVFMSWDALQHRVRWERIGHGL